MKYFIFIIVVILLALGAEYYYSRVYLPNNVQITSASSTVTSPVGGERLTQGETYTLSWTGGADPIQIFLVDRSLKDSGASVSITDRIYGIRNEHVYNYTVPTSTKPGEYEFQIGDAISQPFQIVER
jgi:hypothetical protein